MVSARSLVVVAHAESATVERLAEALRATHTVRTAYDAGTLLGSLDDEVDVVLVDPALPAIEPERLVQRRRDRSLYYAVGELVSADAPAEPTVETVPEAPTDEGRLGDAVDRLAARAVYRRLLDRYYEAARERAALPGAEGETDERTRRRLDARLERIRSDLREARSAFETDRALAIALDRRAERATGSDGAG